MARPTRFAAILAERQDGNPARRVDLCVALRLAEVEQLEDGTKRWKPGSDEELLRLGGRWDRQHKAWIGEARVVTVLRVHRGQEAAARWLARWFRAWLRGDWTDFRRVFSALFIGGRRGSKSDLALRALVLFAVAVPRATVWAVSPTIETGAELDQALAGMVDRRWCKRTASRTNRVITYRFANGAQIALRSGARSDRLKAGRIDLALLNEAQLHSRSSFVKLRTALDAGGLVIMTANPPDKPGGRWVEEHYNGARSGAIDAEAFDFDPEKNPWIDYAMLASSAKELDERTYNREVRGLFQPPGDVVFFAWDDRENWRDPPATLVDITAEVTRKELGRAAGYVVGFDFQRMPHMPAAVCKVFRDPDDPEGTPLVWVVDEVVIDEADELDVLDTLEGTPRWTLEGRVEQGYRGWREPEDSATRPVHCAGVLDASAWWQDGAHSKGRTSDQVLRSRRWGELYKPQKGSDRNPDIVERCKVGNALLKAASGRRRLFVAKHCTRTAEALRSWEMRHGAPYRRSDFAHLCDAVTYVVYRFFGVPKVPRVGRPEYHGAGLFSRADEMRGVFGPPKGGRLW